MVPAVAVRLGTDYAQTLTSVVPSTVSAARRWNTARTRGIRDHRRLLRVANLFGAAVGSTLHLHIQSSVANGAAPPTTGVVGMIPALPRMPQQTSQPTSQSQHHNRLQPWKHTIRHLQLPGLRHQQQPQNQQPQNQQP